MSLLLIIIIHKLNIHISILKRMVIEHKIYSLYIHVHSPFENVQEFDRTIDHIDRLIDHVEHIVDHYYI